MEGRRPEGAEPILGLWIFAAGVAHIFAGYWLVQAFLLSRSQARFLLEHKARQLKQFFSRARLAIACRLPRRRLKSRVASEGGCEQSMAIKVN